MLRRRWHPRWPSGMLTKMAGRRGAPHKELPFAFAESAMAAGVGLTRIFRPVVQAGLIAAPHEPDDTASVHAEAYQPGSAGDVGQGLLRELRAVARE